MREGAKRTIRRGGWPETVLTLPADRGTDWTVRVGSSGAVTAWVMLRGLAGDETLVERPIAADDGVVRIALPAVLAGERLIISAAGDAGTTVRVEVGWRAER